MTTSDGKTFYSYSEPNKGSEASSRNSGTGWSTKDVASAHTHGNYDPKYDNNEFSQADKDNVKNSDLPIFMATTNGSLKKYDPVSETISTVSTDMPSDPKDPTRVNAIDPVPLPKNEPTRTFGNFLRDNFIKPFGSGLKSTGPILMPLRIF